MKGKIIGAIAIIVFFIACNKDKLQTKPSIKLKSISSKFVPIKGMMNVELEFADKEGDIVKDTLLLIKVRNNERETETVRDTILLFLPDYPAKDRGLIEMNLDYDNHLISASDPNGPGGKQNDSLTFKIILKDNASNVSDTLKIDDIVIER